ncbi:cellulase family glycosylhydrolase [Paenibacillus sp. LMG 31461]|uniref:Beta-galactosidase n=1 Tax=Paenibacillus plantarum TaxID=2654975 RepID=A0ABX1X8R3_9BACL|nr:beta-galactosidase [Paenibacillus plantarum]NOU64596.1 cellulase family glycosylhydrolase [Paenibacillus plantarum]
MEKTIPGENFDLGVCYYPEQWPEGMWADDYRRMREIGFTIVRMGEFAWNFFEPEEGVFAFDLFDRAIDLAHEHGLKVILGTPTATPPAWMTYKYPEILNANFDGVQYQHGMRRHYNYSSPIYREYCAKITEAMAQHYANNPGVVGWQIDNELNCEVNVFYAEADHAAFRKWVQEKYSTLEALNETWGTVFWNQSYSDWEQVHLTRPAPSKSVNPHQALDEKRFISDNTISFARLQADILRELAPTQWITTNGMFGHLDSHAMTDELLDFFSFDSYPNFSTIWNDADREHPLMDRGNSNQLTKVRSISPTFCIMEQQSGPGGWVNTMGQSAPKPGQMRLWTYQSVAHGADMVLYFRWRTATFGTEIYWHGINDYHNRPNRRVTEAATISRELGKIGEVIAGSRFAAEVAILHDYDNEWDGELDVYHGPLTRESQYSWGKALQFSHIPYDYLYVQNKTTLDDLARYKVLVYPHPAIMSEETAELLKQYVAAGGKLLFGARSGYKDQRGHCRMIPFPGLVAELCGVTVEDFTLIVNEATTPNMRWIDGGDDASTPARLFNDILHPENENVQTLALFDGDYYAGKPALTRNPYGSGEAYYFGAAFSREVADALIRRLGMQPATAGWAKLPPEVEVAIRVKQDRQFAFILNYTDKPVKANLLKELEDLLEGARIGAGELEIAPYGVKVLEL